MESSDDQSNPRQASPGRFTKVSVQTRAGELEARLSEMGNWELRIRHEQDASWRLACSGDLDTGAVTREPVGPTFGEDVKQVGPLEIDPAARSARVNGTALDLSRKEFALLLTLASAPDRVYGKAELQKIVWGETSPRNNRTLLSHTSRLRNKLRAAGMESMVINCWGVGYKLWDRGDLTTFPPLTPAGEAS